MDEKERQIKSWILKNGYPFEMKVANLFQKKGFKITQSILYKDEETNKHREIDIIAYYNKIVNGVSFSFAFVIECKKSNDKPWLVFKNDKLINSELNRFKPFATSNGKTLLEKIEVVDDLDFKLLFPDINKAGYNLVIAFKESKDIAYSSSVSLIKACEYLVHKFNDSNFRQCNFYFPTIIIEGELYDIYLDSEEQIRFDIVNSSNFMNTKVFGEGNSNVIKILSSQKLDFFIDDLKNSIELFFEKHEGVIKEISLNYPTNEKQFYLGKPETY